VNLSGTPTGLLESTTPLKCRIPAYGTTTPIAKQLTSTCHNTFRSCPNDAIEVPSPPVSPVVLIGCIRSNIDGHRRSTTSLKRRISSFGAAVPSATNLLPCPTKHVNRCEMMPNKLPVLVTITSYVCMGTSLAISLASGGQQLHSNAEFRHFDPP
jgi:hypothetical protein